MLGYLSADIICSEKRTVFRERSSRKTVSFEEQIMSKDKYPSIFSQPNWSYCVYYPSALKIGEYPRIFPSFSWGIFANVTRLDQSRASENIWWIINPNIVLIVYHILGSWFGNHNIHLRWFSRHYFSCSNALGKEHLAAISFVDGNCWNTVVDLHTNNTEKKKKISSQTSIIQNRGDWAECPG